MPLVTRLVTRCFRSNNMQTTWTYNQVPCPPPFNDYNCSSQGKQGVLLPSLAALAHVDSRAAAAAERTAEAAMVLLSDSLGIMTEPCDDCNADQQLFKVQHLLHRM
jgi:hypothetical protein